MSDVREILAKALAKNSGYAREAHWNEFLEDANAGLAALAKAGYVIVPIARVIEEFGLHELTPATKEKG